MVNRKNNFIFIFFFLQCIFSYAQDNSGLTFPKYSAGISPSSFLNSKSGVQVSQKLRLHPKLGLLAETAYLFSSSFNDEKNHEGGRLKVGLEYMLASNPHAFITLDHQYIYRFDESRRRTGSSFCIFGCSNDVVTSKTRLFTGLLGASLHFRIGEKWQAKVGFAAGYGKISRLSLTSRYETYGTSYAQLLESLNDSPDIHFQEDSDHTVFGSFNLNFSYSIID